MLTDFFQLYYLPLFQYKILLRNIFSRYATQTLLYCRLCFLDIEETELELCHTITQGHTAEQLSGRNNNSILCIDRWSDSLLCLTFWFSFLTQYIFWILDTDYLFPQAQRVWKRLERLVAKNSYLHLEYLSADSYMSSLIF